MTLDTAYSYLDEMRRNAEKDWGNDPKHYNDPRRKEKSQALQVALSALLFKRNVEYATIEYDRSVYAIDALTDGEKEYLKNVIKPFRNHVLFICRKADDNGSEHIQIAYGGSGMPDTLIPITKNGYQFEGIKKDKVYGVEGLGL